MSLDRRRAWISWDPIDGGYSGYIGALDDEGRECGLVEHTPENESFSAVMAWAAARAAQIIIRPHWDPSTHYTSGSNPSASHPLLDLALADRPAVMWELPPPEQLTSIVGNCAHCDWSATYDSREELEAGYLEHARTAHGPTS